MNQHPETKIKKLLLLFIAALIFSGLTALPIEGQLQIAHEFIDKWNLNTSLTQWINHVYTGVRDVNNHYPFIAYGTDWLAFAHIMIAIVFIGPLRDPVKNIWVIQFGLIACLCIFPFAFIAGAVRDIPIFWQFIDCSFGLIGGLILWKCYRLIREVEKNSLKYKAES